VAREIDILRAEIDGLSAENVTLRAEISELRSELAALKAGLDDKVQAAVLRAWSDILKQPMRENQARDTRGVPDQENGN